MVYLDVWNRGDSDDDADGIDGIGCVCSKGL